MTQFTLISLPRTRTPRSHKNTDKRSSCAVPKETLTYSPPLPTHPTLPDPHPTPTLPLLVPERLSGIGSSTVYGKQHRWVCLVTPLQREEREQGNNNAKAPCMHLDTAHALTLEYRHSVSVSASVLVFPCPALALRPLRMLACVWLTGLNPVSVSLCVCLCLSV